MIGIQINDLTSTTTVVGPPSVDTFPLMKPPVELRCQVYSYLFPGKLVPSDSPWKFPYPQKVFLRSDRKPCYMAILRVNHFIYEKASDYLYRCVPYDIEVSSSGVFCCLQDAVTLQPPPCKSIVRLMRNVNLKIHTVSPDAYQASKSCSVLRNTRDTWAFRKAFGVWAVHENVRALCYHFAQEPRLSSINVTL